MSQILIPVGVLFFLALFVFAFVREARKQRAARSRMYEELAQRKGWRFDPTDDDTVQRLTGGMEAIGCFESPSLGKLIPKNVVSGTVPEGRVWLYEHSRPIYEGEHHHWYVCLIETDGEPRAPAVIRFSKGSRTLRTRNQFYTGEELPLPEPLRQQLIIYSHQQEGKQDEWPTELLEQLLEVAQSLPFRVDVQIHGRLVAVYPAERNASIDSPDGLEQLMELTRHVVRLLGVSTPVAVS
jgi:hypothetical protein